MPMMGRFECGHLSIEVRKRKDRAMAARNLTIKEATERGAGYENSRARSEARQMLRSITVNRNNRP
jgi:hypothetical protein